MNRALNIFSPFVFNLLRSLSHGKLFCGRNIASKLDTYIYFSVELLVNKPLLNGSIRMYILMLDAM